ncbi:MAG TPA: amidohydrolase family protein [Anaeromyxobacter sp.]|nr:amidohydrolase family protein [Anaeromyxobacter sp.]
MRLALSIAVAAALLAAGCRTGGAHVGAPGAPGGALVVRGHVVRPDGSVLRDAAVLVEGNRIARVGPASEIRVPSGARAVGGPDAWIVPGLFDAHVHFHQSGDIYTRPDFVDLTSRVPYAQERAAIAAHLDRTLARYLRSGVTSVVDMGGPMTNFAVRERANRAALAPRTMVAGQLLASVSRPQLEVDGDGPIVEVKDPESARAIVRDQAARHVDLVKLWWVLLPDGKATDWLPVGRAAIEEAHAHGLRVAVHATQLETARTAVEAGADVLVHSVDDAPLDDSLLALLRERRIPYITTLVVLEGYARAFGRRVQLSPAERAIADPAFVATVVDPPPLPAERAALIAQRMEARLPVALANAKKAEDAGVLVVAGTDAGNIGTFHGPAIFRELELYVQAGLTPAQALRAATLDAARAFGRERDLGSVEAGKLADLVVLDADPLADVRNLSRIASVVKDGVAYSPEQILPPVAAEEEQRRAIGETPGK